MGEIADATIQQHPAAAVPAPPPPLRRGRMRVREVSSRFMSPLMASNANAHPTPTPIPAAAESQRSKSAQRRQELDTCSVDENLVPETARSLDSSTTPLGLGGIKTSSSAHRKQQQLLQRMKLLNRENDAAGALAKTDTTRIGSRRPDTPIIAGADKDRIVPSRYRLTSQSLHRPSSATNTSTINGGGSALVTTAAAKLLQEATSTSTRPQINSTDTWMQPPTLSDLRSSMPEVDVSLSTRWQHVARSCFNKNNNDVNNSTFTYPQLHSGNSCIRAGGELTAAPTPSKTSVKNQVGSLYLPPHPLSLKQGADARKGKKLFSHQEDVKHTLKLLYNHYLQWRFTNAKSEASMLAQNMEAERQIYFLGSKILEMREVVKNRRIELKRLGRIKTLSAIVESEIPYLDEWSAVEEDYKHSLSGVIDALLNLSLRLPVIGGVKVDITELKEALDSADKVMHTIAFIIQSFMSMAGEMESLVSELARVMGGERAHIQESGDSLVKAYASQVEECSLRGHLIQLLGHMNCRSHQKQNYSS